MAKILQGNLPAKINIIKDKAVIARVKFVDGQFQTDDEYVKNALAKYGYEVIETAKPKAKKGLDD